MSPYANPRASGEKSTQHPDGEEAHGGGGFDAKRTLPAATVATATTTSIVGNAGLVVQTPGWVAG
jgi:hypothetical protein